MLLGFTAANSLVSMPQDIEIHGQSKLPCSETRFVNLVPFGRFYKAQKNKFRKENVLIQVILGNFELIVDNLKGMYENLISLYN